MEALKSIARHFEREDERVYLSMLLTIDSGNNYWREWTTHRGEVQRALDDGHIEFFDDDYMQLTDEGRRFLLQRPTTTAIRQMARSMEDGD